MKLETGDRVEANSVHGEDGEIKVFLSFVPADTWLLLRMEQRAWGVGGGGGEDGSKQMSGQLHSPGTGSKTEIHTGSYPSIKGANVSSGSTQFFFSFCPRCTSHQSQKEIPEMSFNSMLQIFMEHLRHWYLGMVAEERLKSKDQELAGHSFPLEGKTHVPDNVFRGALFEGSLCDTLTWEGFTKETVSLAVG